MWHPQLLAELRRHQVNPKLYNWIKNYLSERHVSLHDPDTTHTQRMERGSPQGAVLSPILWAVVIDPLIRRLFDGGFHAVAFADDVAEGDTRVELEQKAQRISNIIETWCELNKLQLSIAKCHFMLFSTTYKSGLRGRRPPDGRQHGGLRRNPTIRLNNQQVRRVSQTKYLGLIIDDKLTFLPHLTTQLIKAKTIIQKISTLTQKTLGPLTPSYRTF